MRTHVLSYFPILRTSLIFLLSVCLPASALAVSGQQLARERQCLACHQVDKKRVGPAFTAIAKRYAPFEEAAELLANSVRFGSRQKWGAVPMPSQPQVSAAEAAALAAWILSLEAEE